MFVSTTRFRVRYAETDAMGIVHHSSYIVWFEEGRSHHMRTLGFPYSRVEAMGYYFTVVEVHARYLVPARYDEEIQVETWVSDLRSRGLTFQYRVRRVADGALLVEGYSRHICITHDGRPARIPETLRTLLNQ
ncbi:MAG: acyl-CoA thioesterase [Chloroflexi bacterium]|nr:acyl-CoA thioesterase [Chloroflexota bacterium]